MKDQETQLARVNELIELSKTIAEKGRKLNDNNYVEAERMIDDLNYEIGEIRTGNLMPDDVYASTLEAIEDYKQKIKLYK